jgi:hypothetical protein
MDAADPGTGLNPMGAADLGTGSNPLTHPILEQG